MATKMPSKEEMRKWAKAHPKEMAESGFKWDAKIGDFVLVEEGYFKSGKKPASKKKTNTAKKQTPKKGK